MQTSTCRARSRVGHAKLEIDIVQCRSRQPRSQSSE